MIVQNNMEVPQPKRAKIGRFELVKMLKKGNYCKVKLGIDPANNEQLAFKIISDEYLTKKANEIQKELTLLDVLNGFNHKNIIRVIKHDEDANYIKKDGNSKRALVITMEYASNGELFGYLLSHASSTEELARTFFQALIEAVEFLHNQSIAHGDIKPENILLDENFNIKLTDFSYAASITEKFNEKVLRERLGVYTYAPPEVHFKEDVDRRMIDLFACGMILFTMVTGGLPFDKAHPSDSLYKLLISNKSDTFWRTFEKGTKHYSPEFKNIITCMLALDPIQRLSLAEIKSHPWYNGPTLNLEDLQKEFSKKAEAHKQRIAKMTEEEKKRKEKASAVYSRMQPMQPMFGPFGGMKPPLTRGGSLRLNEDEYIGNHLVGVEIDTKNLVANQYVNAGFKEMTEIFLPRKPESIYIYLRQMAMGSFVEQDFRGSIEVEVAKVNEQLSCVIFNRIDGPSLGFYRLIEEKFKNSLKLFE